MPTNINHQTALNLSDLPRRLGMQRGGHVRDERTRYMLGLGRCREILTKCANGGNSGRVLAAHEQHSALRHAVQVNAAPLMLLDDLVAVTTAGAAA